MRVLIINTEHRPVGGGAGVASANIASTLSRFGHDVIVLTCRVSPLSSMEVVDGTKVYRVDTSRQFLYKSSVRDQISFALRGCKLATALAREWTPNIIISFFGFPSGFISLYLQYISRVNVPYIVSLRGGDVPGFREYDYKYYHKFFGPLLKIIWSRAAAVVANSSGLRNMARDFYNGVEVEVIPNGVNSEEYNFRNREWSPARILSVGRVNHQKGHDILLKALSNSQNLPWDLTIAGDGDRLETMEALAKELNIYKRVTFLGWKSSEDIKNLYKRANLFVLPSRDEGMSNAILEAMASGLPIIASNVPGNKELIDNNKSGIVFPINDVDALQQALHYLIPNDKIRKLMGGVGRKRAKLFPWTNTAEQYLNIIKKVLKEQR